MTDLIGVSGVLPGHVEHVSDLLCQPDAGATVGCDVDSRDAALSRHLRGSHEQHVLLGPEWAYLVCDVITDDNDLTSRWIFRCAQGHPPCHHTNLDKWKRGALWRCKFWISINISPYSLLIVYSNDFEGECVSQILRSSVSYFFFAINRIIRHKYHLSVHSIIKYLTSL